MVICSGLAVTSTSAPVGAFLTVLATVAEADSEPARAVTPTCMGSFSAKVKLTVWTPLPLVVALSLSNVPAVFSKVTATPDTGWPALSFKIATIAPDLVFGPLEGSMSMLAGPLSVRVPSVGATPSIFLVIVSVCVIPPDVAVTSMESGSMSARLSSTLAMLSVLVVVDAGLTVPAVAVNVTVTPCWG